LQTPWLSAIVPTYNGERYLRAALESVKAQDRAGLELIAIDDGSTDGTLAILEEYSAALPLRVVQRPRTGNWVATTNHALSLARGEYACFLHQDDLWLDGRVEALARVVKDAPDAAMVVHPSWFVDDRGKRLGLWRCPLPAGKVSGELVARRLIVQNFLAIPAPIFRRELALRAGGMDEALWYTADWDLWLTLARAGDVVHEDRPLAAFRIHGSSQTSQRTRDEAALRGQLDAVLQKHLPSAAAGNRRIASVAAFSVDLNVALSGALHRGGLPWARLVREFVSLGPLGWRGFVRDSRIAERVFARVRCRLRPDPA
jgi:GT2 family glycosyltransferase